MSDYSVHDEEGFARVYDEDEIIQIRKGDVRALLDLATGSMNFASGFWDNEQVEIARKIATILGIDPKLATPHNFACQYNGEHQWGPPFSRLNIFGATERYHACNICHHVEPVL
jgi:hypothetical protein